MTPGRNDGDVALDGPYPGILPVLPPDALPAKDSRSNAATGATAAGVRALSAQAIAFYFRAPAKAFFRTRVDYLAYARSFHEARAEALAAAAREQPSASRAVSALRHVQAWMRGTTLGVLSSVVRHHGWGVIPQQVLPPLIANVGVGAVLYTSYLHILGRFHEESAKATARVYPPPSPTQTFAAGFLAGSIQSVVAAPLDAIQARHDHRSMMPSDGSPPTKSMWRFGTEKLREIGLRGIFAGWGLSFMKDSLGSAVFFSTFEYVKAQGYYRFVTWYYGALDDDIIDLLMRKRPFGDPRKRDATDAGERGGMPQVIRPHYAIEPMFLLCAGISASAAQQVLLYPLHHIQVEHWDQLEEIDAKAIERRSVPSTQLPQSPKGWRTVSSYYHAYQQTLTRCRASAAAEGMSLGRWLYRGFWWSTIRQVPSTSAGLIIFELVRRKYGMGGGEVRITRDGYDILLS